MKISAILFLSLLSRADASGLRSIRGEESDLQIDFGCTIKGGSSQNTCDDTKADDGSQCVWCSVASYGVCVSGDVAEQIKQTIPGLMCDDDGLDDDVANDDSMDDDTVADDDTSPSDDSVPDDYWDCLEKYSTSADCTAAGCAWCDNKGGYGVCFDVDIAKGFDDSDWYSCTIPSVVSVEDPSDPSCFIATIGGDESSCTATMDAEGKACDWCSFQGFDFCMNNDQAELAKQYGASCGDDDSSSAAAVVENFTSLSDPSDPSCLVVTIGGDESTCKDTTDVDGKPCDWCSFQGYDFCVNVDQAQIVEQYGASCGDRVEEEEEVKDPSDPSCLVATLSGDESSCKATMDADGKACEWCSLQGYDFCMNGDQAEVVEQYGASCGERVGAIEVSDPSDPTCLVATLSGDESSCKATMDADGKACEWCSFQGYDFCMNEDQAEVVEQYGASCGERVEQEVSDPSDPTCLVATLNGDESACKATMDADGKACEWCSFQGYDFCMNEDQAEVVEQYGASCGDRVEAVEVSDPSDPTCLVATLNGDESACKATMDADGKPCEWCSFQGYDFCMNEDQAEVVEQYGASCDSAVINVSTSIA